MAAAGASARGQAAAELVLPEQDFTYVAGAQDRPWHQFTGRWAAMKPRLAAALGACGAERPLRVVDVGSCTGFFSLQAAHEHPEADVVGVEGSVGIGNGSVGMDGSSRQILRTPAVQTHLRWIHRLGLPNCFVAPEVWDYVRICNLVSNGRPICDVMFNLSVIHHVHGVSVKQYTAAGFSLLDGLIDLIGKLLLLAPHHFIELPNRPWIQEAHDHYGSQRAILEAAAKASGREWQFTGPIYVAEWFGRRELWLLEARTPLAPLDIQMCPFPLLYRDDEQEDVPDAHAASALDLEGLAPSLYDDGIFGLMDEDKTVLDDVSSSGVTGPPASGTLTALGQLPLGVGGRPIDPGLMLLIEPFGAVDDSLGMALTAAPTDLLVAHLALREAVNEAQEALRLARSGDPAAEDAGGSRRFAGVEAPALSAHGRTARASAPATAPRQGAARGLGGCGVPYGAPRPGTAPSLGARGLAAEAARVPYLSGHA